MAVILPDTAQFCTFDDRQRALEAGCDDFDTKPINFSGLLDKMTRLLHASGESDQTHAAG